MEKPVIEAKDRGDDLRVVVFDLETRKLAADVGGWDALRAGRGGVSAIAVWDNQTGRHHLYDDSNVDAAARHLEQADVVLSFNGAEFDVPVIEGLLGRRLILQDHVDILQLIWRSIHGRRKGNTLDEVSKRCLGYGKIGKGASAPALADENRWAELFDYCIADVELTRLLFWYAQQHNGVVSSDGGFLPLDLPLWFGDLNLGFVPEEVKIAVLP